MWRAVAEGIIYWRKILEDGVLLLLVFLRKKVAGWGIWYERICDVLTSTGRKSLGGVSFSWGRVHHGIHRNEVGNI